MTDKELKRLGKSDLIEIIYQQKKQELELRQQLEDAEQKLADRRIRIAESGSLAEAALKINGIFEAAQEAADTYLAEIKASNAEMEQLHSSKLAQTEYACRMREQEADARIAAKWAEFERNVQLYIQSKSELTSFFRNSDSSLPGSR